MAYLTLTTGDETKSSCFKFIGSNTQTEQGGLISSTTSLISNTSSDNCLDTCSFYTGPSDSDIMAFGESYETVGSVAYGDGSSSGGSYSSSGETCGSVASSISTSSSSSFSSCC